MYSKKIISADYISNTSYYQINEGFRLSFETLHTDTFIA